MHPRTQGSRKPSKKIDENKQNLTFFPEISGLQLEQPRQLPVQKINHSLRLDRVQPSLVGAEPRCHGLVLGQVIYVIATPNLTIIRNPVSIIPQLNPTTPSTRRGSAAGIGIGLAGKRLS